MGGQLILLARLLFVAAAALFFLSGGTTRERDAGAIDGTAGTIPVSVNKTLDGQGITASAVAPEGTLIYEIAVHLCINGSDVRNVYDFGFQGRKCVNTSVGGSDVEQAITYPNGSQTAEIPYFKLGQGTVRWVNSRGYDQVISCLPGATCDAVVQLQITNDTVHYQAPICFDAVCAEGTVGWTPPPPPPENVPPANEPAPADADTDATDAGAAGAAGAATPSVTTKSDGSAAEKKQEKDDKLAAGSSSSSSSGGDPTENERASGVTVSTTSVTDGPSQAARVRAAAIAGAAGGVLIMGLVVRGRRMMDDEGMML
jgi:hypothetical protein